MLLLLLIEYFINRYSSSFHVQEYSIDSIAEIQNYINASLMTKYENGSIIIDTLNVGIKHLGKATFLTQTRTNTNVQLWKLILLSCQHFSLSPTKLFRRNYFNNLWTIYLGWSISSSQPRNAMHEARAQLRQSLQALVRYQLPFMQWIKYLARDRMTYC